MHNCEEFRELITEYIIDRDDASVKAQFQHELLICSRCSEFYAESCDMMEALSEIDLMISERQWQGIHHRLQARILQHADSTPSVPAITQELPARPRIMLPVWVASMALLLVTIGLSTVSVPVANNTTERQPQQAVYVEHSVPLDPVTVDFLEESELLLRNVMKMEPTDMADLAETRKVAGEQLAELRQRKEAAAEVPPVVGVMDTYETILRDLRNVDERNVNADISDIQRRIQQNGLIANMKAFQPRVTPVSFGLK
jgi:hypothetical protein